MVIKLMDMIWKYVDITLYMDTKYIYTLKSWKYKADRGTNLFLLKFSVFYKHP